MDRASQYQELLGRLRSWGMRMRWQETAAWAPRGLGLGLAFGLALAVAARIWPLVTRLQATLAALLLAIVMLLGASLIVWLWRRPALARARALDRRLGLAERLSTAIELWTGRIEAPPALAAAQVGDACESAKRVDANRLLPIRLNRREGLVVLVLLAGLAGALVLPNPQEEVLAHRAAVQAAVDEQIERLEQLREAIQNNPELTAEDKQALIDQLNETEQKLQEAQSQQEAMAEMAEAQQRFEQMQDPAVAQQAEALQQAGEQMAATSSTAPAQELGDALANGDYAEAAAILQDLSDPSGRPLTPAEQKELAEKLAQAAEALKETNPDLAEKLAEASQALQAGDIAAAQGALGEASQELGQTGSEIAANEAAQQAASAAQQGAGEVASAGEQGQGQPGQSGQSDQPGQAGQPGQSGQQGSGDATGPTQGGQSGHHEDTGTSTDQVYSPGRVEGGEEVQLPEDSGGVPGGQGEAGLPPGDASTVPYSDVYASYAAAASTALESDYIPLGYRSYIRDYFASLDPNK